VENCWKILLLMGIGVSLKEGDNQGGLDAKLPPRLSGGDEALATEERLFLITFRQATFSGSTNFCH
jgi:hypothetical protein